MQLKLAFYSNMVGHFGESMTTPNHFKITATIQRAKKRLDEAVTDSQRIIELAHIEALQNLLAEPTSDNIMEDSFE